MKNIIHLLFVIVLLISNCKPDKKNDAMSIFYSPVNSSVLVKLPDSDILIFSDNCLIDPV